MKMLLNKLNFRGIKSIIVLIGASIIGGILSFTAYNTFRNIGEEGVGISGIFLTALPGNDDAANQITPIPTFDLIGLPSVSEWDGANRVTVLVMGLDYRDWESGSTASRSDTMILLTLDPVTKTAGILSIPRDLWANIPGFNPGKINTAHYLGEIYQVPGGGPALAIKTVEATIGVSIDYFARIDFFAFEKFIDHIGGVKINIPAPIRVHPIGGFSKTLNSGIQVLPGNLALAYARVRNSDGGDFSRSERQQQVILAIRDRLIDPRVFSIIAENSGLIYSDISSGISTNLTLENVINLAFVAIQVDSSDIKRGVIDERYVTFGTSPDELAILIPIPDKIRTLRDEIFANTSVLSPFTPGSTRDKMIAEFASISLTNGSNTNDFGNRVGTFLISNGANIITILDSSQKQFYSTIIDHKGRPFTVKYLVELLNIPQSNIKYDYNPNAPVDIELIVGNDTANNSSIP